MIELFLLVIGGNVLVTVGAPGVGSATDIAVSAVLIFLSVVVMMAVLLALFNYAKNLYWRLLRVKSLEEQDAIMSRRDFEDSKELEKMERASAGTGSSLHLEDIDAHTRGESRNSAMVPPARAPTGKAKRKAPPPPRIKQIEMADY